MRVPIPDDTKKLIEDHKEYGDFTAISKRLTKTFENPEGDSSRASEISQAYNNGIGAVDIVKALIAFYNEKAALVAEINAMAQVKAAS